MKIIVFGLCLVSLVSVSFASDLNGEIANAAQRFEKDYGKFDCSVDGTPVSLGALSYALAINEGGYKKGTVGYNTNNWGSLHHKQVMPIKGTTRADGVTTRPIYHTVEDGLYDKLYLITHKKMYNGCNFGFNQLFGYIVGPRSNPDSQYSPGITKRQYVNSRLKQLKQQALIYDGSVYTPPLDEGIQEPVKTHKPECTWVGNAKKGDYIQLDSFLGQLLEIFGIKQDSKVFICNNNQ